MHTRFLDHRPPLTALAVIGALVASLFFHGRWLGFLSLTLAFEIFALLVVAWRADGRFAIPVSALTLFISLFWAWLALTLLWTPVPATSGLNFWWLGSLPLIYWISLLASGDELYWRFAFAATGVIAVLLAAVALYQYFHLHALPRSVFLYTNSQDAFLNLITLPLCAYLIQAVAARRRARAVALSAAVGLLIFVVALTGERAPAITLIVGLLVLVVVVRGLVPRGALGLPFALAFAAYGLAGVAAHGEAVGRLATLAHPAQAAATRVVIWRGALALLAHVPWHGIGLGLFSLAYPPYRHYGDTSAGFFVHDDYLQIAIEAGWVGLLLFLAVLGSVAVTFFRGLPARGEDDGRRIEMAGLFGALLTVAVHSLVDFNFYIPSILVLSGLILGRLHALSLRP
ncbi:MAG: O-antigen ligase family protein, partial [Acidiferrobacteraceae bacterium]